MAPDPQDENPILEKETETKDDENDLPTVSNRYPVTNMGTSADVGSGAAIGDNSPFTTDDITKDE
jgi:hypothetical protein